MGRKRLKIIVIFYVLCVLGKVVVEGICQFPSFVERFMIVDSGHEISVADEWNLIMCIST